MVNKCLALLCTLLLVGCSSVDLSDISTTAGASAGAVGAAVLTTNPAGILIGTVAGGVTGAVLVEDEPSAADVCIENPEACVAAETGETIRDFLHWIIGGGVVLIIVGWLIPGPQSLWRRKDAPTNSTRQRVGYRRPD